MTMTLPREKQLGPELDWKRLVACHKQPSTRLAIWQLVNTLVPYVLLWGLMIWTYQISYWITLPLTVLAAGFLIRTFIIFHDCVHASLFASRRANRVVGFLTGVLTLTPYEQWRQSHVLHHGTSGDLDRRGTGDIWMLTVQEYLEASRWKRFAYRLARNPLVLFVFAPLYLFLIEHRFPTRKADARERRHVRWTNILLLAYALTMWATIGLQAFLLIQLPVLMVASAAGVWLFYVQHQFEGVYWERQSEWDFLEASLKGSSYYKLPRVLQWFTGNIGFHHIHHLSPNIPNYNLEKCHRAAPVFQEVRAVTLWSSFKALSYRLWDEQRKKLVGYRSLRAARREQRARDDDVGERPPLRPANRG